MGSMPKGWEDEAEEIFGSHCNELRKRICAVILKFGEQEPMAAMDVVIAVLARQLFEAVESSSNAPVMVALVDLYKGYSIAKGLERASQANETRGTDSLDV